MTSTCRVAFWVRVRPRVRVWSGLGSELGSSLGCCEHPGGKGFLVELMMLPVIRISVRVGFKYGIRVRHGS